ncbi:MAG: hypothetical protein RPT25_05800 [Cycloclasticus sp.]
MLENIKCFLSVFKYQLEALREDIRVYWSKRGDESLLHSILYIGTCHGLHAMFIFRLGKIIYAVPIPIVSHVLKIFYRILYFIFSTIYGIALNPVSNIGAGFYIGHYGGIFVRGDFGSHCSISQGVTFGSKGAGKSNGWPKIGNNVYVGAGAKVIGNIEIGSDCIIGANAVVTISVPDCSLAVGVPASYRLLTSSK